MDDVIAVVSCGMSPNELCQALTGPKDTLGLGRKEMDCSELYMILFLFVSSLDLNTFRQIPTFQFCTDTSRLSLITHNYFNFFVGFNSLRVRKGIQLPFTKAFYTFNYMYSLY